VLVAHRTNYHRVPNRTIVSRISCRARIVPSAPRIVLAITTRDTRAGSKRRQAARSACWRPMEVTEEAQRSTKAKSGFKGVKVTSSRKYQPQIWCPELGTMRALGSYETAEEAAVVLIEAKREGACWEGPMDYR
jgi:hypothetical protein